MNQWTKESVIKQMNKQMDWTMGRWMDRWVSCFSVLSYFFTERPLCGGKSQLLLLWAASQLALSVASAAKCFSSRSCCNAFSNLQLQSCLRRASQHHSCFAARSRANAFCHSRFQTSIAGALATVSCTFLSTSSHSRPRVFSPVYSHVPELFLSSGLFAIAALASLLQKDVQ